MVSATLIVVALVGLALFFGRQQRQSLRWLTEQQELQPEDRRYHRRQAWLRLVNCGLMLLLALLMAGYYLLGLNARVNELVAMGPVNAPENLNLEQKQARWWFGAVTFSMLVLLMTIVFLVAIDIWSIRRYGRRHMRQIDADRRAMVEDQLERYRSERDGTERNGHS
jgi:hypothetical protein